MADPQQRASGSTDARFAIVPPTPVEMSPLAVGYNAADVPQLCFQGCSLSPSQGPFPSPGPELHQLQPWVPAGCDTGQGTDRPAKCG